MKKSYKLPEKFQTNILSTWGEDGSKWLKQLPVLISSLVKEWNLQDIEPFENLSYNYVAKVRYTDQTPIILKLGCDPNEIAEEAQALMFYNGRKCAKLLQFLPNEGALFIESISPGTSLKELFPYNEERAIKEVCSIMKELHSPPLGNRVTSFPKIDSWLKEFDSEKDCIASKHFKKASKLASSLLTTQAEPVLLHGDLHYENILKSAPRGCVAIDPKGVIGEKAYEVGAFIRNPLPDLLHQPNVKDLVSYKINHFSKVLNINKKRLKDWSYVQAVLAVCWASENPLLAQQFTEVVEVIDNLDI